jgi:hypothetical protein
MRAYGGLGGRAETGQAEVTARTEAELVAGRTVLLVRVSHVADLWISLRLAAASVDGRR